MPSPSLPILRPLVLGVALPLTPRRSPRRAPRARRRRRMRREVDPATAMRDMGVTERDAKDLAASLETLR